MISNMIYIAEVIIVFAYISKCANIKILIGNTRFFLTMESLPMIRLDDIDLILDYLLMYKIFIDFKQEQNVFHFPIFVWNISEYQTKLKSF